MSVKLGMAIAIAALAFYGCAASGDESVSTTDLASTTTAAADPTTTTGDTTTTSTTMATTTSAAPQVDVDQAVSMAEEYFQRYNSGNADAVLELFTPEATFADNFGPQSRSDWEQLLAWNLAQGTQLESVECTADEEAQEVVTVICEHTNHDAVVQAVEAPPVPVTLTLAVTADGIADWEFIFGQPDFLTVLGPFGDWMSVHHPDDAGNVGFGNWNSVESAADNGELMAQYAEVWKTYLADNGCSFADGC